MKTGTSNTNLSTTTISDNCCISKSKNLLNSVNNFFILHPSLHFRLYKYNKYFLNNYQNYFLRTICYHTIIKINLPNKKGDYKSPKFCLIFITTIQYQDNLHCGYRKLNIVSLDGNLHIQENSVIYKQFLVP